MNFQGGLIWLFPWKDIFLAHQKFKRIGTHLIIIKCKRGFWCNLPNKCCGDEWRNLYLHTPWYIHVLLSHRHHLVPIWWPELWHEVWIMDLQRLQGKVFFINILFKRSFLVGFPARKWGWRRYCIFYTQWRMGSARWEMLHQNDIYISAKHFVVPKSQDLPKTPQQLLQRLQQLIQVLILH